MRTVVISLIALLTAVPSRAGEPVKIPAVSSFSIVKAASKEFKEVKAAIDNIIAAAKKGDIERIVAAFSKNYLNSGRDIRDVRKQWLQILENFSDLELQHPIYNIEVSGNFARMRCEGILYGRPKRPEIGDVNEKIVIDSWKLAVHNFIKEDGVWKILGDQVPYDTGRTHHPLF
jgi:hypothetical protein